MDDDNHQALNRTSNGKALLLIDSINNKMRSLSTKTILGDRHHGFEDGKKRTAAVTPTTTTTTTTTTTNTTSTTTAVKPAQTATGAALGTSGKRAIEQNFILSTLKGVANALKSSHRNSLKQSLGSSVQHRRPTSAISSASSPPISSSSNSSSSSSTTSTPHSTIGRRRMGPTSELDDQSICSITESKQSPRRWNHNRYEQYHHRHSTPANGVDIEVASNCSTSSSVSSNLSSSNIISSADCYGSNRSSSSRSSSSSSSSNSSSNNNFNVTISSDHMSLLDSMKFDQTSDIESIKKDLIKICRENRLEILAHYVSQIG